MPKNLKKEKHTFVSSIFHKIKSRLSNIKYWEKIFIVGLILIISVPIIVNIIMQIRLPWNIVYDGDWLGFFGAFFGAVFTVVGAIYVSFLNTKKENKRSYYLELLDLQEMIGVYSKSPILFLEYKYMISNISAIKDLEDFLTKEKENIDRIQIMINRLRTYSNIWKNTLTARLLLYKIVLSSVISQMVQFMPKQHIKREEHYMAFYIYNYKKSYDDLLIQFKLEEQPYNNEDLQFFLKSLRLILESEIKRIGKDFNID